MPQTPYLIRNAGFNVLRRCRYGFMLYNRHDIWLGRSFEEYGEFSEHEVVLFRSICRPGDIVVDVGANVGAHTIAFARLVGDHGQVYAFEPQRIVFQALCANAALNSLTNIHAFHAAVGDGDGMVMMPPINYGAAANFGGLGPTDSAAGEKVPLVRLDDALHLAACRFLKIDVEGMEESVLRGADALIRAHRPIMCVENDRREKSKAVLGLLMALDYRVFWFIPRLFNKANYFGMAENVFGNVSSYNVLAIPAEIEAQTGPLRQVEDAGEWIEDLVARERQQARPE